MDHFSKTILCLVLDFQGESNDDLTIVNIMSHQTPENHRLKSDFGYGFVLRKVASFFRQLVLAGCTGLVVDGNESADFTTGTFQAFQPPRKRQATSDAVEMLRIFSR